MVTEKKIALVNVRLLPSSGPTMLQPELSYGYVFPSLLNPNT
jgi:hypothetical protein